MLYSPVAYSCARESGRMMCVMFILAYACCSTFSPSLGAFFLGGMNTLYVGFTTLELSWLTNLVPLGMVWIINIYNFMDGIDGLAGAEAVIVGIGGGMLLADHRRIGFGVCRRGASRSVLRDFFSGTGPRQRFSWVTSAVHSLDTCLPSSP